MYLLYKNKTGFFEVPLWPTLCLGRNKNGGGGGGDDGGSVRKDIIFFEILNANILAFC